MARSQGERKRTRRKLSKRKRERGLSPISRAIQRFEPGDRVHIKIDPSVHKGMPHHRFHGLTGRVKGERGRAFVVQISDGRRGKKKAKELFVRAEHLRRQETV
ncbi:50S ribosomal protein L21e [ANME-1 cluster archaeon ex4572_4]|nr:50S ribosomal protein L21e [Methanophagales archaeon]OYT67464.1 MAG: 50S ribosomal protein L21e [ANME-1 cluster archaeon ex4572_4]PXF51257.1 MAG: 50S ribosomal protein L21e [Methanophagales archaeon]HDN68883.1 50S ribosomal protein L21e [Methanomicrobia archaeon]